MKIVEQLRRGKYKVRVIHRRVYLTDELECQAHLLSKFELHTATLDDHQLILIGPLEKGGECEVEITSPAGKSASGKAECSTKDNYCRKEGLMLAIKRALKQLKEIK
jgi:hypothetical protein